ncbi:hypothetical protein [Serratia sp. MF2]|uniref:hypothetical protein n=1 Tax=Serratia sp. MF2 TaxID=3059173 RepID=UPI0027F5DB48|nr:hypothetical protein [Serratia sp. MF2]MDQ7101915.1 hypothetical protein [Serratia sp. MF2]
MKYANLHGYSEIHPFEIVKKISEKTIELRRMKAERDPSWKPEIIPGGFAGHCVNQHEQRWFYSSDESAPIIRARLRKDGFFYSSYGKHVFSDNPRMFYDYNF